ncbi:hypothetical protein ASPWEDRAFT_691062 [Aspergillus wentii DTO 134E9]|uniref:Uncharacterized protein n=1 Tax=Aspergillus wentii DTO 134E9 TaxID=1073089 RepID=A0A1L9R911_ASPWE|nr:uncharacterized protein ASPWEDRAFT_691062 [Aspergillus wentii DTO 134E9]OJJ31399.1 hypothetical protein ASPWEDRAFT_691062 [Aspergillus wentii DTO 134E9]
MVIVKIHPLPAYTNDMSDPQTPEDVREEMNNRLLEALSYGKLCTLGSYHPEVSLEEAGMNESLIFSRRRDRIYDWMRTRKSSFWVLLLVSIFLVWSFWSFSS